MNAVQDNKMDLWEPRRVMTLAQARHRSNLVGMLRMFFMAGATISAGCFVGPVIGSALFSNSSAAAGAVSGVTMLNPRFTGRDSAGNAYVLVADTARRRLDAVDIVDLDAPIMEDALGGEVRAKTGVFDRDRQVLTLDGKVEIINADGYYFISQNAVVNMALNTVVGVTPLIGKGPLGEMRADRYEVSDNGKKTILNGNVWTRIDDTANSDDN